MTVFDFIQQFILFVIPGIITYLLFVYLTDKKALKDLFVIAVIFICSTISFIIGNFFLRLFNLFPWFNFQLANVSQILAGNTKGITVPNLLCAIAASVILGFLAVLFHEKRLLFRFANTLKISSKTDNKEVWDSMFVSQPWVIVRDYVSGNVYYGCVTKYSDKNSLRELLLTDVKVWSKKDGEYHMEHVYISRDPSEFSIEIDQYNKENKSEKSEQSEQSIKQ